MSAPTLLERNLRAASDPNLEARLRRAGPAEGLVFQRAAGGALVPARSAAGRAVPYHSLVDPVREAERLAGVPKAPGYVVLLGLGGGYLATALLQKPTLQRLLVVEPDPALTRAVLENIDLIGTLADPRTRLLPGPEPDEVESLLVAEYLPALHGDLAVVPLRASFEEHGQYSRQVMEAVRRALERAADDYTVQARFGRRWFANTLANLEAAQRPAAALQPAERAVVAGAGPSLEPQLRSLGKVPPGTVLIAADAALPALRAGGFMPDVVVSIDCQLASYHHFLPGLPESTLLALDLASPPVLGRLSPRRTLFFATGHPFSRYLAGRWRPLPELDTSGGNVAQAAVSLAVGLGAREIQLLGLDFSYPRASAYARGTYLYPVAWSRQTRLLPVESWFQSFLLDNRSVSRLPGAGGRHYRSRALDLYRERLESYTRTVPVRLTVPEGALPGRVPLSLPEPAAVGSAARRMTAGPPGCGWRSFLASYRAGLRALPPPVFPLLGYFAGLGGEERALWATLLPAAAALRASQGSGDAARLLERVRDWSAERVSRCLGR